MSRFPSCLKPLFQSEAACKATDVEMIFFYSHANETRFLFFFLGFVLNLAWTQRVLRLRRSLGWPCVKLHYGTCFRDKFCPSFPHNLVINNSPVSRQDIVWSLVSSPLERFVFSFCPIFFSYPLQTGYSF